jgi:flagellar motility protein MotE (MotC chaperone)
MTLLRLVAIAAAALVLLRVADLGSRLLAPDADPIVTGSVGAKGPAGEPGKTAPGKTAPVAPVAPAQPGAVPASATAEANLIERLGERRRQLDERAQAIETREALLKAAEKALEERVAALEKLERQLEERRKAEEAARTQEMEKLAGVYQAMRPKEAARVIERLPPLLMVDVARLIKPRNLSEIVAAMDRDAAVRLTTALARPPGEARAAAPEALPPGELPRIGAATPQPAR